MAVSREELKRHLKAADGWLTSSQLARTFGASENTVAEPLKEWVVDGLVERSTGTPIPELDLRSAGVGNSLWRWRTSPISRPQPTDRLLCRPCSAHEFGDRLRYLAALAEGPNPNILEQAFWRDGGQHACARCGRTDFMPPPTHPED